MKIKLSQLKKLCFLYNVDIRDRDELKAFLDFIKSVDNSRKDKVKE